MERKSARASATEMTRAAKITYLLALLVGFSAGAIISFRMVDANLETYSEGKTLLASAAFDDFAYVQYKHADDKHSLAAMQSYTDFLEQIVKWYPASIGRPELQLTYTRMALVEDAANSPEQSHVYMTKARHWATTNGRREPSDAEMKRVEKILEEHGLH
jgi:hypothetical protein